MYDIKTIGLVFLNAVEAYFGKLSDDVKFIISFRSNGISGSIDRAVNKYKHINDHLSIIYLNSVSIHLPN